jgi:serine/threonine-protein kinase
VRLRLFGGLAIDSDDGAPMTGAAARRRPLALLAVVAANPGVSRDRLAHLFWPDSDAEHARNALNQALFALRRDLGRPELVIGTAELRLDPAQLGSDVADFEATLAAGDREKAVALYAGPLLDGVHIRGAEEFERWLDDERGRRHRQVHAALHALASAAVERGDPSGAVRWWEQLATLDPLDERIACEYMKALAAAGNVPGALRHARVYEQLLQSELSAEPGPAMRATVEQLRLPVAPRVLPPAPIPVPAVSDAVVVAARGPAPEPVAPQPDRTRMIAVGAAIATALLAAIALVRAARLDRTPLDPVLVAVAPFDVLDPRLGLWHEGMTDVLSRTLDGAGPLRTVAPARVMRSWQGHADRESAGALGRATGARLVLVGSIVRAGADSLRVTATLVDVSADRIVTEVVRRGEETRMDRLTDAVALAVIQSLGASEPVAAVRQQGLAITTSMEALKAFLAGEQSFRRAQWTDARHAYEQALAADSGFALALHRVGIVMGWQRLLQDSASLAYLLRAGALNHGLAPRDSLLVAADSIVAAITTTRDDHTAWELSRRLFATLDVATQRYPDDPEIWLALGEARYHLGFGPVLGVHDRAILDAFDRAIALDPRFAPAYLHTVELGLNLGDDTLGLRYARTYLALNPTEAAHRGVALVEPLLEPGAATSRAVQRMLDTASAGALVSARTIVRRWPDSAETAVRLSRLLALGRPSDYPLFSDTIYMRQRLAQELAFRGHLTEAARLVNSRDTAIFAELALLGAVPASVAGQAFSQWLAARSRSAHLALGWWAARRDTTSIAAFAASQAGETGPEHIGAGPVASYDVQAAEAYESLARGDTTRALRQFAALADTLCPRCYADRLVRARLRLARGELREALADLDESVASFLTPFEVVFALERARAERRAGDRRAAALDYRFVARAWRRGDPSLRGIVAEAASGAR